MFYLQISAVTFYSNVLCALFRLEEQVQYEKYSWNFRSLYLDIIQTGIFFFFFFFFFWYMNAQCPLFITGLNWKQPKYPSTVESINKWWSLLGSKNEQIANIHSNLDGSQKHCQSKKLVTKEYGPKNRFTYYTLTEETNLRWEKST